MTPVDRLAQAAHPPLRAWIVAHRPLLRKVLARVQGSTPVQYTGPETGVFLDDIPLYRLLDAFELETLAMAYRGSPQATFLGGLYNVKDERKHGAAFSSSFEDVRTFEQGRSMAKGAPSRLLPPLYIVEVNGKGLPFGHIGLKGVHAKGTIDPSIGATSLGFNIRPEIAQVTRAWVLDEERKPTPIDWRATLSHAYRSDTPFRVEVVRRFDTDYGRLLRFIDKDREASLSPKERETFKVLLEDFLNEARDASTILPGLPGLWTLSHNILDRLPEKVKLPSAGKAWMQRRKAL